MAETKESWGSRVGLILAMAGNAVGLGNFLRFPVQAVQNGGGAFIIPYLVSFLVMGIPMLWIEWAIGRYGGKFGDHSTPFVLGRMGKANFWKYFGVFGIWTNLAVASYYCYLESWTLAYTWFSIDGTFVGKSLEDVSAFFNSYTDLGTGGIINFPKVAIIFFLITLILNTYILSRGLDKGVELASKIGMPLLILFGVFLAIKGVTMVAGTEPHSPKFDGSVGLDFLWSPQFDSLKNPKVWMAAAGQIFFTLSVGMGTIQCYASYVKPKQDIALNAMSAGWMNEFVEVVLGSAIVIPIAVGYMGLDWVKANAGFMMGFKTMPFLFQQWGTALSVLAGICWFGLLFFAGITSSLAMGTPWMGFIQDEFKWSRNKSAISFGVIIFVLALPCILFFEKGVFDEFDYWAGTFSLVVFALAEVIIFAWVKNNLKLGWDEINEGSDMKVPHIYKFIIRFVTPAFLIFVFFGSMINPLGGDWLGALSSLFSGNGWPLDKGSVISQMFHLHVADTRWFIDGRITDLFITDMSRFLLILVFAGIGYLVYIAGKRRKREGNYV
ncbi:MAG: sodium:calcium symporter [Bacteroidetes bacterium RIFCSPLOWO2_02_FULL_36_8]|nr:MAG: sodium:calcium symporter [Bacteroidetes bacterium RIFCSPLOWO2_02_FULL_36_8]OFY69883.1 MAG: sodium:calcium symporter [Bacteroidetes bacterium RIFCSPLOWO2_12_FULL_37_12]